MISHNNLWRFLRTVAVTRLKADPFISGMCFFPVRTASEIFPCLYLQVLSVNVKGEYLCKNVTPPSASQSKDTLTFTVFKGKTMLKLVSVNCVCIRWLGNKQNCFLCSYRCTNTKVCVPPQMLQEIVAKTLKHHGIAVEHECFEACSKRLFDISKFYLKVCLINALTVPLFTFYLTLFILSGTVISMLVSDFF